MSAETPPERPLTVTFNVDYSRPKTTAYTPPDPAQSPVPSTPVSVSHSELKTADLSHISDKKAPIPNPSLIPSEFTRELSTPIPVGDSIIGKDGKTWKTTVFPSNNIESRQDVQMIGDWLNQVLEQNKKENPDPLKLATNARHWFTAAYEELCRQVSLECPERSQLLLSIWKRYQDLFTRVIQLHEEEKSYLTQCHKVRISALKSDLDQCQLKLKTVSQKYRDDQESWSNSREREDTKFANMRKRLDLQIKNRRNLLMQIRSLKEKLGQTSVIPSEEQAQPQPAINPQQLSDRVHSLRQQIRSEFPYLVDILAGLDDIAHYIDQERLPSDSVRAIFPSILADASQEYVPRVRSVEWAVATVTYLYATRLLELVGNRESFGEMESRQYFAKSIFEQLLTVFGFSDQASETFLDLVETIRKSGKNKRFSLFLRFMDLEEPFLDSVYLDFYCFCFGSILASNTGHNSIFPDVIEGDEVKFAPIMGSVAIEAVRKILYSISEAGTADAYVKEMKETMKISEDSEVPEDDVLDFLMEAYNKEEQRVTDILKEQYDMDAAQYGGITTLGQFQTLAMFSPRKIDYRQYTEMMREIQAKSSSVTISFKAFISEMHSSFMLVPFSFDRIDYCIDSHLDDIFGFMKSEYKYHKEELELKLSKAHESDDALFKQLSAARAKFEQVVETKRAGAFTEVAQRELYEKLKSLS